MIMALPWLVALIGLVIYLVSTNARAAELGRLAFGAGLLVGLLRAGSAAVSLLPKP